MKIVLVLLYLFPQAALAEVADKSPSIWINIAVSLTAIVMGLIFVRIRWWLFPISLLLVAGLHAPILSEIYDSEVGPAMRLELGAVYIWQPQLSALLGSFVILFFALSRKRQHSSL